MTVYFQGDLHGSVAAINNCLSQIENPTEQDVIVVCGDAGLEYGAQIMGKAKKAMKKFPGTWLIVRGNHDNRYWRDHTTETEIGLEPNQGWSFSNVFHASTLVQNKYSNIHYASDSGEVYCIDNQRILTIPGAYSVDKHWRLMTGMPYELEEQLTYREWVELSDFVDKFSDTFEFVVAHSFPKFLEPQLRYLFMDCVDQSQVDKTTEEWLDVIMQKIEKSKSFKHYFGGHYHDDKQLAGKYTMLYQKVVKMEDYL